MADAEHAELKLAELKSALVQRVAVVRAARTAGRTIRDAFVALPPKVAAELASMTDPRMVENRLAEAIRDTLNNLVGVMGDTSDAPS